MTIIKQRAVTENSHQRNLRAYINDDRKVLLRGSQNMEHCTNIKRWASFMEATRRRYGHDKSSRHIRDKKTGKLVDAKNTILYHQILGFLPEECSCNGGKLTPDDCLRYAKEYAAKFYPHQEVVFAVHNEYCKADKTHRYAVHMVINRSDLETGNRLDEGRGKSAKVKRASRIRDMDAEWGLHQVERDEANSRIHKKQPSKVEREIEARGGRSYKYNLRELCRIAAQRAEDIYEFREMLEGWGVETEFRRGRMYVTDTDHNRYSFSVKRLDADLGPEGLARSFDANLAAHLHEEGKAILADREAQAAEAARIQTIKESYLREIEGAYLRYRKQAHGLRGTDLESFPKLKLPKPPEEVAGDAEVRRTILAYWRGADELRVEMAANVPYARGGKGAATKSSGDAVQNEERSDMGRTEPNRKR